MADLDGNKTVIVDRDHSDRSSPAGWIILAVLLVLALLFFMSGGFGLFGGNATDTTNGGASTETQLEGTSSPTPTTNPAE